MHDCLKLHDFTILFKKKNANFLIAGWFWGLWGTYTVWTAGTDDTRWMSSRSGSFWHCIPWKHLLSDVSWRNDLKMAWFFLITCTNHSLWIGWLRVILPAIHSLRAKVLTSGWVTKLASLIKKLSFPAQLVWSRMKGLFMLITQIEVRISLKYLGFFISLRLLKSLWLHFLYGFALLFSSKLVWADKFIFSLLLRQLKKLEYIISRDLVT